jgi:hypothetical protein
MHGRIVVDGRDQGGGCALTPEIVVTAAHVVRAAGPDSRVAFAAAGREAIAVESIDRDIGLDLAALRLAEPVVPSYVSDAAVHDRWEVSVPPQGRDAFLTGTVDVALRDFENDRGHRQQVVQLRVEQELKQFAGYSGSGVRLSAADGAVAGVLTEQQLERTRSGPGGAKPEAANVLFAVPVAVALDRFGLTSAATTRPPLPGDTEVTNFMPGVLGSAGQPVPFGGRATELRGLDEWSADPSAAPRMLVVGPAGSGKSTLLAHWLHDGPAPPASDGRRPPVVFVPLNIRFETAERDTFYRIMTARIARAYRENVALAGRGWDDLLEEQSRLLRRPPPDGSLLIVIDGLDEALGWNPGPNLMPAELAPGVGVMVSARMTAHLDAAGWADRLGWQRHATLVLGPLDQAGIIEVMVGQPALSQHRDEPALDDLAREVHRLSQNGDPLVVGLSVQEIEERVRGTGMLPDPRDESRPAAWAATVARRSPGRAGFIAGWREQQERSGRSEDLLEDAERVLNVLAVAEGPLSRAELRTLVTLLGRGMDGVRIGRVIEQLERLVLPGGSPDSFVIAHPAIGDELRAQLERDEDMATYRGLFTGWGVDVLGRLRTGELVTGETPVYLVRHLAQHLSAGAGLHPAVLQLATPYWRRVKDAVSDETTGFRTDLETVMARARRLDAARVERGESPRHLPERVMCAAEVAGNRQALATSMTAELAAGFVRASLWRPQRALSYVDEYTAAGLTSRVDGVAAVAPVVPEDQLPELSRLVLTALESTYHKEQAVTVGAWARRLFELGRLGEALDAASRLAGTDPENRGFVEVWVLADLIPVFEDDQAAEALARAIDVVRETRGDLSYAACRLTQNVPVHRADELWRTRKEMRPAEALAVALLGGRDWRSITSPGLMQYAMDFKQQSKAFVAVARWLTDEERGAFIARGLELALGTPWWVESAQEAALTSEMNQDDLREALLPGINYDGLLSVLPAADAAVACDWVRQVVSGHKLLGCLAQLLPLLDASRRRTVADELFEASTEEFRDLDGDLDVVRSAVPAIVAAGLADRLVDRIRSDTDLWSLPVKLAPHLTEGQASTLLGALPAGSGQYRPRNAVLTRWASFGKRQTIQAFDEAYAEGASDAIDPDVMRLLRAYLSGDRDDEPEEIPSLDAWWLQAYAYVGSHPKGGTRSYRRDPQVDADDIEAMLQDIEPDPAGHHVVDVAFALARRMTAQDVPRLLARAGTLADPWLGLTLLAAGTHLPAGAAADTVTAEICARLDALRAASPEPPEPSFGYPHGSHWLMHGFSGWAPFFARVASPAARATIADQMFAGGYLDGVVEHEDLDSWAADALGLTPLLTHEQLAWWEVIAEHGFSSLDPYADAGGAQDPKPAPPPKPEPEPEPEGHIQSGTVRSYFYAGIAVGYAARGDFDDAYRVVDWIGGPHPEKQVHDVFAEILGLTGSDELPAWIAKVHETFGAGSGRGPLWAHLFHRLPELTDEQMWTIVDRWLADVHKTVRTDVFGDALLYRHAIARVAGKDECARLMALVEERESLNSLPRPDPREHTGPTVG